MVKKGFNWKARQVTAKHKGKRSTEDIVDTNIEILPSKVSAEKEGTATVLKRKLRGKERKRYQKIVEIQRKKAQHAATLESLKFCSLPDEQLSLLQPSAQIGKALRSPEVKNQVVAGDGGEAMELGNMSTLMGTTWRSRNRKRRRMRKSEKVACKPRLAADLPAEESSEDGLCSDDEDRNSDEADDGHVTPDEQSIASCERSVAMTTDEPWKSQLEDKKQEVPEPPSKKINVDMDLKKEPVKAATFVQLHRDPDIQCARLALPILSEEQVIMEAINDHSVVVLCGETGSGKTTQVPQFLYEAGYAQRGVGGGRSLIGVTEPRRVAAVSMARRVGVEMGVADTGKVAYQIRYAGTCSDETEVKFMTDGVLLKEVEQDFLLSRYSVVIVDEAHERSVFTDILIGLLSRIVPLREKSGNPLKLVIMSATLRVEDFTENRVLLPRPPPLIRVESRQYPVTIHFNRQTPEDYVEAAFLKTCKIHRNLQPGGILVFVTGQKEVHSLCRRLSRRFPPLAGKLRGLSSADGAELASGAGKVNLDSYPVMPTNGHSSSVPVLEEEEDIVEGDTSSSEEGEMEEEEAQFHDSQLPMRVLPLYSLLSPSQQRKVFEKPPDGVRLCVVATNVAETSLTIPTIKYVVDSGKVKRRYYDKVTGISTFRVCWTSKSSANQRAGRAGRTEPGHCYRLYSSAVFHNVFEEFSPPEISRRPVDDLVLQMKAMNIDRVANFPFPTPPSQEAIHSAEDLLHKLGALDRADQPRMAKLSSSPSYSITPLGCTMANFPLAPRYAKMLALGRQHGCLPYVIALVAALSVREIFASGSVEGEDADTLKMDRWNKLYRSWVGKGESLLLGDLMVLLRAVGAWDYSSSPEEFCRRSGLRHKALVEVRKLRQQLTNIVNAILPGEGVILEPKMPPLSQQQVKYIRQMVFTGLGDHVAHKVPTAGLDVEEKKKLSHAYQCTLCEDVVHLPSSSVLYYELPEFVVFQEITETTKLFMRGVCAVDSEWFPRVLPEYCTFSEPLDNPPPEFDDVSGTVHCHMSCSYGTCNWPIGIHEVPYPKSLVLFKLFGMFLLQGKVLPDFGKFSPHLLVAPMALIKKWSSLHHQCEVLVTSLANSQVASRDALLAAWEKDPNYLFGAYSQWLPEAKQKELVSMWPLKKCCKQTMH